MKKILMALMTIAITIGLASGAAYALFSDTAKVTGVTVATGNADLLVAGEDEEESYVSSLDLSVFDSALSGLYPGFSDWADLYLMNNSASNIDLKVTAKLTYHPTGAAWDALKETVKVRITADSSTGTTTSWKTLKQMANDGVTFPDGDLAYGDTRRYVVHLMVDSNAGNEIANKTLSNMQFTLTGTQN